MKNTNLNTWHTAAGEYFLTYTITRNRNFRLEEEMVYEYGMECFLQKGGEQIAFESIDCISPDYEKVFYLVQTLKRFQVFPVHVKEVLGELMECDEREVIHLLSA